MVLYVKMMSSPCFVNTCLPSIVQLIVFKMAHYLDHYCFHAKTTKASFLKTLYYILI